MSDPQPRTSLSLFHLARSPLAPTSAGARPPLLALLHGVGSNEEDLFSFAPELDPRFVVVSARAPLTRAPGSYAWFSVQFAPGGFLIAPDELEASRERLRAFLGEAVATYGADPQRVYLLGFSQGAILALALALTAPQPLAGVVALSGRIPPEIEPRLAPPAATAGLPIFLAHGTADAVIPFTWFEAARVILERQRVALDARVYPGMAHTISPATFADLTDWLAARLAAPAWSAPRPAAEA